MHLKEFVKVNWDGGGIVGESPGMACEKSPHLLIVSLSTWQTIFTREDLLLVYTSQAVKAKLESGFSQAFWKCGFSLSKPYAFTSRESLYGT